MFSLFADGLTLIISSIYPCIVLKKLLDCFLFTILPEYIFLERLIIYINEFIERSVYRGIKKNSQ